ncbi:hypothetical protein Taro_003638 [Colocasia esculenta]|uniref:F-box domain-containing protein n=1 Tax=Colocasia esculenta TaxID=4460 RepID=A0A843TPF8_COLES|nr:hypothetical protein [Colocasia esculenta]
MEMTRAASRAPSTTPAGDPARACLWTRLGTDLTELILSLLPLRSIVRAGAVCKFWRSIVDHPAFASRVAATAPARMPWFFLYGQNNVHLRRNQAFAFDPAAGEWVHLPPIYLSEGDGPHRHPDECFVGSGGFIFATSAATRTSFCYAPLLRGGGSAADPWRETPPLHFSRRNPVVGVIGCGGPGAGARFIVAGGVRLVGGLVDIEDQLAVEIYDPAAPGGWQLCPPLPPEFRGSPRPWSGGESFYVFGIYSGLLARFDLSGRAWSGVRTLRPPRVSFSFLVACGEQLVLAGLRGGDNPPSLVLWRVADGVEEGWRELGQMPEGMLAVMFEGEEEERFASLRCVGVDGLLYVFNEAHHRGYPACVCEVGGGDRCNWKELPPLPGPVNRFHRVIAFCSAVPLDSVIGRGDGDGSSC